MHNIHTKLVGEGLDPLVCIKFNQNNGRAYYVSSKNFPLEVFWCYLFSKKVTKTLNTN